MERKFPISVVILTKNEQDCISECLESVEWADEIIVVDDESTDKTVEFAREHTDRIFTKKMDVEGRHRNWAYAQAKNIWVLSLDADEQVSNRLKEEIIEVLAKITDCVAFDMPLKNYIGDYWVRYGGWYPAAKIRLFRKDRFKYEESEVHPRVFIDGKYGHLKSDIIHKGYPDLEHFLNSVNRQSTLEAIKWINTNRKMSLAHAIWRTIDRFFRRYIRKQGYQDGLYGFIIAFFDSLYQVLSYTKYIELKNKTKNRE